MPPCQHCQREIAKHVLRLHETACAKHPGNDELLRRYENGETITMLARSCQVSRPTVHDWLCAAGVERYVPPARTHRPPVVAYWELSVFEPCVGGCSDCEWIEVCRARVANGAPLLGEAPLGKEIIAWYLAGWIPRDFRGEELRE